MPGLPPALTYVRRFSSGKLESPGTAGRNRGLTPLMRNGTTPSHASPSKVSRFRAGGTSGRNLSAGTGQCMKSRSCQLMLMAHGPVGAG